MPFYQCNSSGLVKRYVDEVGSDWVRAIVVPASAYIVRSCRKITFPNLRDCCTILGESSPCFAWNT
jgi:hypothetical protein